MSDRASEMKAEISELEAMRTWGFTRHEESKKRVFWG